MVKGSLSNLFLQQHIFCYFSKFFNYNIIKSFPSSLSFLWNLPYTPRLSLLNLWHVLVLIVMYLYLYVYTRIFLNVSCSLCILILCMFSELTTRYWMINYCAPPWSRLMLLVLAFLISLYFSVQGWGLQDFLWPSFTRLLVLFFFSSCLGIMLVRICGCVELLGNTISQQMLEP